MITLNSSKNNRIFQILFLECITMFLVVWHPHISFGQPLHPIHRWALVICIDSFPKMPGNELHYPVQDAKAFANFLRSPAGGNFDSSSILLMLNNQANYRSIIHIFSGWGQKTALND